MVKNHEECKYYLPCGWCDKNKEKCIFEQVCEDPDKDEPETNNITNETGLIEDYIEKQPAKDYDNNPICSHEWYCSGADTQGWSYTCRKCGKTERRNYLHIYTPGTPLWINPNAPDSNKVGDFPPYNEVTCTSGYINTNKCPEQEVDSILTTNVTTCAQSTAHELSEARKFIAEVKSGNLPKIGKSNFGIQNINKTPRKKKK
jgi:hypothetical protein